jgi:hypothetical protein
MQDREIQLELGWLKSTTFEYSLKTSLQKQIENIKNRVATSSAFCGKFPFFPLFSAVPLFCINNFILLLKIQHRRKPDIIQ